MSWHRSLANIGGRSRLLGVYVVRGRPRLLCCRIEVGVRQGRRPADRGRELSLDLRSGPDLLARGKIIEDTAQAVRAEILIVVIIDLRHRRVYARAQAFDLDPGKLSIR